MSAILFDLGSESLQMSSISFCLETKREKLLQGKVDIGTWAKFFVLIPKNAIPYPENEGVARGHEKEDGGEADFRPNGSFNISSSGYEISDPTSSACRYGPPASLQHRFSILRTP